MFDLFHDALHEGRLTFAVSSDECYLISSLDGEVRIAEYRLAIVAFRYIFDDDGVVA